MKKTIIFSLLMLALSLSAAPANILRNPGFEYLKNGNPYLTGWLFDNPQPGRVPFHTYDDTIKNSGKYALKLTVTQKYKDNYKLRQRGFFKPVVNAPGKLTLSARVRGENVKSAAVILKADSSKKREVIWKNVKMLKGSFDWQTVSITLDAPANLVNSEVSFRIYDTGTLWVDDVSITLDTNPAK